MLLNRPPISVALRRPSASSRTACSNSAAGSRAKLDLMPPHSSRSLRCSAPPRPARRAQPCLSSGEDSRADTSDFSECWNSA